MKKIVKELLWLFLVAELANLSKMIIYALGNFSLNFFPIGIETLYDTLFFLVFYVSFYYLLYFIRGKSIFEELLKHEESNNEKLG